MTESDDFAAQVADSALLDPRPTLEALSQLTGVAVGALIHHAVVTWCAEGSAALLAVGPRALQRMVDAVEGAEAAGTDEARQAAYAALRDQLRWLAAGSA